ncbi:MAG: hypothetical protein ACE15E_25010 [Acidobacteriota bacterium]
MPATSYWFAKRMANHESGYRQFDSLGYPLPNGGHDGGYGLFQVTPPSSAAQYWNWKANVTKGKSILDSKRDAPTSGATAFWDRQVQQFSDYNAGNPQNPVQPPESSIEGTFTFAYAPAAGEKSYRDAIWIKQFNGAAANYISWKNTGLLPGEAPYWKLNKTNESGINYVNRVCTTSE